MRKGNYISPIFAFLKFPLIHLLMKKIILLVISLSFFGLKIYAQEQSAFTHYQINPVIINPAAAGFSDDQRIFLHARNQWTGFPGAPKTYALSYDGPIIMQGSVTSPSWTEEFRTNIHLTKGDFKFIDPIENKYKIDNGAKIVADEGNIVVGNIFGRKFSNVPKCLSTFVFSSCRRK